MTKVEFEGPCSHLRFCTMHGINLVVLPGIRQCGYEKKIATAPNTPKLPSRYNKYLLVTVLHLLRLQLQIPTCRAPSQQPHQTPAAIPTARESRAKASRSQFTANANTGFAVCCSAFQTRSIHEGLTKP